MNLLLRLGLVRGQCPPYRTLFRLIKKRRTRRLSRRVARLERQELDDD